VLVGRDRQEALHQLVNVDLMRRDLMLDQVADDRQ